MITSSQASNYICDIITGSYTHYTREKETFNWKIQLFTKMRRIGYSYKYLKVFMAHFTKQSYSLDTY